MGKLKDVAKSLLKKNQKAKAEPLGEEVQGKSGVKVGNFRFVRDSGSVQVNVFNDDDALLYKFSLHPTMDHSGIKDAYHDVAQRLQSQLRTV